MFEAFFSQIYYSLWKISISKISSSNFQSYILINDAKMSLGNGMICYRFSDFFRFAQLIQNHQKNQSKQYLSLVPVPMDKLNHPQHTSKSHQCSFCRKPSEEIRTLLRIALYRIRKLLLHQKYLNPSGQESGNDHSSGINRLIRVLFERHQFELKYSKECQHDRLRSLFCEKLKCRPDQLQLAIDQLCDKVGRRNYQLELIATQVKNVENSVLQLQDSQQVSTKARKGSQSSGILEPLLPTAVKIQEIKDEPVSQQRLEEIGGYVPSYEGVPFSYNIIYYGASFYQ